MNSHIKDLVELREAALKKVAHYEEQAKLIQKQIDGIGSEVNTYAKLSDLIGNPNGTHKLVFVDVYMSKEPTRYRVYGWVKSDEGLIINARPVFGGDEVTLKFDDVGVDVGNVAGITVHAMFSTSWLQLYAKRRVELILSDRYES